MAGSAGKSGGPRPGSGRKSKAEELELPALIDEVVGKKAKENIIKKLAEQAEKGSYLHMQLFLAYAYGKPQDKIDLTTKGKELKTFILNVRPDAE